MEIRLGCFKDGKVSLEEGQIFTFTNKDIEGTNECVSITYKELYKDVQPGGHILVDDGLVDLEVQDISGKDIVCKVINAGVIGDRKGVNVPGANLKMPFISKKTMMIFSSVSRKDLISLQHLLHVLQTISAK